MIFEIKKKKKIYILNDDSNDLESTNNLIIIDALII